MYVVKEYLQKRNSVLIAGQTYSYRSQLWILLVLLMILSRVIDALRKIGSPNYICFMIEENGMTLILAPYPRKDFHSHRVSREVYSGEKKGVEISSLRLCTILAGLFQWKTNCSCIIRGLSFFLTITDFLQYRIFRGKFKTFHN